MKPQLSESEKQKLKSQSYLPVGSHSAVKVCGWTRNMLRGEGSCYKHKFYGIRSSQCLQMTTSISCANRCIFCWRDLKSPVSKDWKWQTDTPEFIFENSIKAQKKLLTGFKGYDKVNREELENSKTVKHVALSLTGEPICYPKINQLIDLFHKQRVSTFLVTNAQYPKEIKKLHPVTQLYLSLDAPNQVLLKKIDVPLFKDYWKRCLDSLKELSKRKERTCIRLTLIKGINTDDSSLSEYADLIKLGNPDFVEVKSYMHVGEARTRGLLSLNMLKHFEVKEFTEKLNKFLPNYELASEHLYSRVCLLAKKSFKNKKSGKWETWIDFEKFFKIIGNNKKGKSANKTKNPRKFGYNREVPKEIDFC